MDDNSIRVLLAEILNEMREIKNFLAEQQRERAAAVAVATTQAQTGKPAALAYLSSKWPRRDGDKYPPPRLKRGNDPPHGDAA